MELQHPRSCGVICVFYRPHVDSCHSQHTLKNNIKQHSEFILINALAAQKFIGGWGRGGATVPTEVFWIEPLLIMVTYF